MKSLVQGPPQTLKSLALSSVLTFSLIISKPKGTLTPRGRLGGTEGRPELREKVA